MTVENWEELMAQPMSTQFEECQSLLMQGVQWLVPSMILMNSMESLTTKLIFRSKFLSKHKILTISNALCSRVLFHEIKQYTITDLKRSGMINNAPGISLHPECHYAGIAEKYPQPPPSLLDCRSIGLLPLTNGSPCLVSRLLRRLSSMFRGSIMYPT